MTPEQLHILQHSLGVDQYGQGKTYRNHYCVGLDEGNATLADIRALVALGWMVEGHKINEDRDQYFHVTQFGQFAMKTHSPKPPKVSRGRQRYLEFLNADSGMTFGEFLKWRSANKHRLAELGYTP